MLWEDIHSSETGKPIGTDGKMDATNLLKGQYYVFEAHSDFLQQNQVTMSHSVVMKFVHISHMT